MISFKINELLVEIYPTRAIMGLEAAKQVSQQIKILLEQKQEINILFAAAPSQSEFLQALIGDNAIEWNRINAFHMDEYLGLSKNLPQSFGNFLKRTIFDKVPFKNVYYINGEAENTQEECNRYSKLISAKPIDIVCLGIGENGHIAFNDPHVALFDDPYIVKTVDLDDKCRIQQVNDGCFPSLEDVPEYAYTLTIPALTAARYMYCLVPGCTKRQAIKDTIEGPVHQSCPASILKNKPGAILFTDRDAAALLKSELFEGNMLVK